MGKKGGKKGGKKKKGPTYHIGDEDCQPFGFKHRDIVRTPLGLVVGRCKLDPGLKARGLKSST